MDTSKQAGAGQASFREHNADGNAGILVVEDEAFVRHVTCEVLESAGYYVFQARNATEAITVFKEHAVRIQLLLTDQVLPGQSGRELAKQLRYLKSGLKAMLVSGYPENSKGIKQLHGISFLAKPFSSEALLCKVREILPPEEAAMHATAGV